MRTHFENAATGYRAESPRVSGAFLAAPIEASVSVSRVADENGIEASHTNVAIWATCHFPLPPQEGFRLKALAVVLCKAGEHDPES